MLGFCSKIFHHCNSHKGLAFFFFYNSSKILLVFLSLFNLRFGRYRNCSNPHIYFFPARSFAQVEFEDCANDRIRNKISHYHTRSYHVHMIILVTRFAQQSNQSSNRAVQESWLCPQHLWMQMHSKNPDSTAPLTNILNGCGST